MPPKFNSSHSVEKIEADGETEISYFPAPVLAMFLIHASHLVIEQVLETVISISANNPTHWGHRYKQREILAVGRGWVVSRE